MKLHSAGNMWSRCADPTNQCPSLCTACSEEQGQGLLQQLAAGALSAVLIAGNAAPALAAAAPAATATQGALLEELLAAKPTKVR